MNTSFTWAALCAAGCFCGLAFAQVEDPACDWSEVTALAQGALVGQNVSVPVPGFELMLLHEGRVVYRQAFGNVQPGQVFAADSATKTLSGALIMSLTERAAILFSLDTKLSQLIGDFDADKQSITIRQCFAHIAGFAQTGDEGDTEVSLREAAINIANSNLRFRPSQVFSYGGTSMHAAGAVAEIAGGQPWNELFRDRITDPLGMVNTRFVLTTPENPRIAGGCESTAPEFARFMEMLRMHGVDRGRQVLRPGSVEQMFTRQTPVGIPVFNSPLAGSSDYGVGVWLDQRDSQGNLVGALAAGARGFAAWIDFDDELVGVFATDKTQSANVQPLYNLIRDAAQRKVRCRCGPADVEADGMVDLGDLLAFFECYDSLTPCADLNADGVVDLSDFLEFFNGYDTGC